MYDNPCYMKGLIIIEEFKNKYSNLGYTSALILKELLSAESLEYYYKNSHYSPDASKVGLEFETDLKKILVLEDELKQIALQCWKSELTDFNDIVNGERFMIVGHASHTIPGTKEFQNYKTGSYSKQYLSCSLLSNNELNTFMNMNTVYITDVTEENYISSSSFDTATRESSVSFETLKTIEENGNVHNINVGYSYDSTKGVTTISTPTLIENLSIERKKYEEEQHGKVSDTSVNEVVLDRTTTKIKGAILFSNGCDLLISDYLYLKANNIKFKCINKSLYKKENEYLYNDKEYLQFLKELAKVEEWMESGKITSLDLFAYYQDVVIPMKYSEKIQNRIKETFSKYIEIPSYGIR